MTTGIGRFARRVAQGAPAVLFLLLLAAGEALAQKSTPFGISRPEQSITGPASPFLAWILSETARYYQLLVDALKESKQNGTASLALITLSFGYGVFHAAGPGHGKAVISSYLFANDEAVKRGIALSCAFALVQALSAIAMVSVLAAILNVTAQTMDASTLMLERLSNFMVMAVGAWLFWRKGRALWGLIAARFGLPGASIHVHDANCGHLALPTDSDTAKRNNMRAILAAGLRPCTGAIIVLVFAWRQGIYGSGIIATFAMGLGTAVTIAAIATVAVMAKSLAVRFAAPQSFAAAITVRTLEMGLAFMVFALGLILLAGVINLPSA
ncbi:nickel/cobalt transporter [Labrys sp. La1]|uniref:nickel/cobalt transporter n=1 Tax=Labrys sp. La1 TaxID=3404917 RepID=UPI003EBA5208